MKNIIKRFIVWYLCKYCNCIFNYNGKTVRVFSEEFYNDELKPKLHEIMVRQ